MSTDASTMHIVQWKPLLIETFGEQSLGHYPFVEKFFVYKLSGYLVLVSQFTGGW